MHQSAQVENQEEHKQIQQYEDARRANLIDY